MQTSAHAAFHTTKFQVLLAAVVLSFLWLFPTASLAQSRPSFCDQTPASTLSNLQAPYAINKTPQGVPYCEGLLVKPISFPPPEVVSVKQLQPDDTAFSVNGTASLNWCDDMNSAVHIQFRSTKIPLFALDAFQPQPFSWNSKLIGVWQPKWQNIAASGTKSVNISGQRYTVFIPVRIGRGYSSAYTLLIRSRNPLAIRKALVQPIAPKGSAHLLDIAFGGGPSPDTWQINLTFDGLKAGIYRVTFQDDTGASGEMSKPIYLLHKVCRNNG